MESRSHNVNQIRRAAEQVTKAKSKALNTSEIAQKQGKLEAIAIKQKRVEGEGIAHAAGEFYLMKLQVQEKNLEDDHLETSNMFISVLLFGIKSQLGKIIAS